jgi:hypothetical protein
MPDSVWMTVGTLRLDWKTRRRRGRAGFSPVDGGPAAGKRQSHDLSQGPRGCAGFSLGDGGHIAARRNVSRTAGAGPVQSMGQLACRRKLEVSSHDKSQGPGIRAGFGQVGGGHVAGRREDKRSSSIPQVSKQGRTH